MFGKLFDFNFDGNTDAVEMALGFQIMNEFCEDRRDNCDAFEAGDDDFVSEDDEW